MKRSSVVWCHAALAGVACFLTAVAGCGVGSRPSAQQATSDHHHHEHEEHDHDAPQTLADAITQLTGLRNVIRDSFAAGDDDAAHDPLHEIGHCLEAVNRLADTEKAGTVEAATIKAQVEVLFKAYGDVDKTMHGQEGRTYSEVSKEIDDAFVALLAAAGVKDPLAGPATDSGKDESAPGDAPASEATSAEPETSAAPAADSPSDAPPAEPENR